MCWPLLHIYMYKLVKSSKQHLDHSVIVHILKVRRLRHRDVAMWSGLHRSWNAHLGSPAPKFLHLTTVSCCFHGDASLYSCHSFSCTQCCGKIGLLTVSQICSTPFFQRPFSLFFYPSDMPGMFLLLLSICPNRTGVPGPSSGLFPDLSSLGLLMAKLWLCRLSAQLELKAQSPSPKTGTSSCGAVGYPAFPSEWCVCVCSKSRSWSCGKLWFPGGERAFPKETCLWVNIVRVVGCS